jgi:hypothetical protein
MSTELSGIQVTSLHGLLQDQGMSAPNISSAHDEYQNHAGVTQFYNVEAGINSGAVASSVVEITGEQGQVRMSGGTYIKGQAIVESGTLTGNGTGISTGTYFVMHNSNTANVQITDSMTNVYSNVAIVTGPGDVIGSSTSSFAGAPVPALADFATPIPGYDPTSGGAGTVVWNSGSAYSSGDYVRFGNKIYRANTPTLAGESPTTTPASWTEQDLVPYTVFTPAYLATTFSIADLTWLAPEFLKITRNSTELTVLTDYTFNSNFTQITLVTPPLSTETVTIQIRPRLVFLKLAPKFPAMIGRIPDQFSSNLGNGNLIIHAYNRTIPLFPNNGCRTLTSALGQVAGYAQQIKPVMKSVAQVDFGSTKNPAGSATAGLVKVAGNADGDLSTVGEGFIRAGDLINLQNPWVSFSALGILLKLVETSSEKVGNLHYTIMGKSILDTDSNTMVVITPDYIRQKTTQAARDKIVLRDTAIDKSVASVIRDGSDTADVNSIKQYLKCTSVINNFADLLNTSLVLGAAEQKILSTAGDVNLVRALSMSIKKNLKVTNEATASALGQSMKQMQNIPGDELNALTQPSSQIQYEDLLASMGSGSGENGALLAEDCLGQTNYIEVLEKTTQLNSQFESIMQTAMVDLDALKLAIETDYSLVTTSDGSSGFADWGELMCKVKTLVDPVAEQVAQQVEASGKSSLLRPFNRLAESHNTSIFVYSKANVNLSIVGGDTSVINFVSGLQNYGKNTDKFLVKQLIEDCCVTTGNQAVTGQAIIAALREAQNTQALENSGIANDTFSSSAKPLDVPESAPGLVGGGSWPAPSDPYANLPSSATGA